MPHCSPPLQRSEIFGLEANNFQIPSNNWKPIVLTSGELAKANPQMDVIELASRTCAGEQLFTYEACMRETKRLGKIVPSVERWNSVIQTAERQCGKSGMHAGREVRNMLEIRMIGGIDPIDHTLRGSGNEGFFWTNLPHGAFSYYVRFEKTGGIFTARFMRESFYSVRCLLA